MTLQGSIVNSNRDLAAVGLLCVTLFLCLTSPVLAVSDSSPLGAKSCVGVNGFLEQVNIVSVINSQSEASLNARIDYFDDSGQLQRFVTKELLPREKWDVIINDLGLAADTIGTACVTTDAEQSGIWFGGVTIYKPDLRIGESNFGEAFDYALYYPFENSLTEATGLGLNTYRFAMPQQNGVANWISIYDASPGDDVGVKGKLVIFDQSGNELRKYNVDIPDGGRRDFSGHDPIYEKVGLEAVGLALFTPSTSVSGMKFNATVTRYFYDCFSTTCANFLTAFAMPRALPTSARRVGAVSTVKAEYSVIEFSNFDTDHAAADVSIYNQKGEQLKTFAVEANRGATSHLVVRKGGNLGALESGQLGSADITFKAGQMAQAAVFYNVDKSGQLAYAYATSLSAEPSAQQISQFNSFIGHQNELELVNTTDLQREVRVRVTNPSGNILWNNDSITLSPRQTKRITLLLPDNSYGTLTVHANAAGVFSRNILSKGSSYSLGFNSSATKGLGSFSDGIVGSYIGKKIRIMPLGDSITEGQDQTIPYRYWLDQWLRVYFDFDFVGSHYGVFKGTPLYSDFDQDHEGHSGWRSDQIAGSISGYAATYRPDIVLLHIGTNDLLRGLSAEYSLYYISLTIDRLRAENPLVVIVLAKLIPFDRLVLPELIRLNDAIPALVAEKNSITSPILIADQFTGYDQVADNNNGLHPNSKGAQKMAGVWLNKLLEYLTNY